MKNKILLLSTSSFIVLIAIFLKTTNLGSYSVELIVYVPTQIWIFLSSSLGTPDPKKAKLIIAVLSQLDRLDQRNAIRQTWKKMSTGVPQSKVYFAMPEKPCPIDPLWRIRESICSEWRVRIPGHADENAQLRPIRMITTNTRPGPPRDGIGFLVKFPLSVTQLGVSKKAANTFLTKVTSSNLTVELVDILSGDVLTSTEFSRSDVESGMSGEDGYLYHTIEEQMLPRHFEGIVRISGSSLGQNITNTSSTIRFDRIFCNVHWNSIFGDDGVIVWMNLLNGNNTLPFSEHTCPLVSLVYQMPDLMELKQVISAQATQNKCQENKNRNLGTKLVEEMEDHEDDVYFATGTSEIVIDTERAAPEVALAFMKFISDEWDFEYLLLTEDVAFISIHKVLSRLETQTVEIPRSWQSGFSYHEPVLNFGQLSEEFFFAKTYPPKPSRSGSILSRDLVKALVKQADHLRPLSTLSASLSVWLAPLAPRLIEDAGFSPDNKTCSKSSVAVAPFDSKEDMKSAWDNLHKCGRVCVCKN